MPGGTVTGQLKTSHFVQNKTNGKTIFSHEHVYAKNSYCFRNGCCVPNLNASNKKESERHGGKQYKVQMQTLGMLKGAPLTS